MPVGSDFTLQVTVQDKRASPSGAFVAYCDVNFTPANLASLKDPARLFNSSLEGKTRRAIDIHEGEEVVVQAVRADALAPVTKHDLDARFDSIIEFADIVAEEAA